MIDHDSMKRVLMSIHGAAKGFKKDKLKSRLAPMESVDEVANPLDAEPDPLDPNEPAEMAEPPESAEAKLEAIRKLIGSV